MSAVSQNFRRNNRRLRFLLLLFLPMALALAVGLGFSLWSQHIDAQALRAANQDLQQDQRAAAEALHLSAEALQLQLQQRYGDLLAQRLDGRLGAAEAAAARADIARQLPLLQGRIEALQQIGEHGLQTVDLAQIQSRFADFSQALLGSSVQPPGDADQALLQLMRTEQLYRAFALQAHWLSQRIDQHGIEGLAASRQQIEQAAAQRQRWLLLISLLLLGAWMWAAHALARRLDRLNEALLDVNEGGGIDDAALRTEVQRLAAQPAGMVGALAQSLLRFADAQRERDAVRRELERERQQLRALVQGMPDLVWLKDAQGAYRIFNQRFMDLTGRSAADLEGKTDAELFLPQEGALYREADERALAGGRAEVAPHWRRFADGHEELIVSIKSLIYDGRQQLIGVLGVGRDITALHQAQQALREREELYSQIVSQAPNGIVLIDRASLGFLSFNEAACRALGYEREEFAQLTLYDLQASMDRAAVDAMNARVDAENGVEFENQRRCKDGSVRDFWISVKPLQLQGRRCLTGLWVDITERKRTERELARYRDQLEQRVAERTAALDRANATLAEQTQALQSSHEELRVIFDAAAVGIVLIRNRRIVRCNRKLEQMLGWAPGELQRQSVRLWYSSDADYIQDGAALYGQMEAGVVHQRERELVRKDGSRFWARMTGARLDHVGMADTVIGLIDDISREHEVAAALRRARDEAESASRAKSAFLANMSHEIRTPMNAIIGLTHLLRRESPNPRQQQQLDKISGAALHLLAVINDILDFSKIEAGKLQLDPGDFALEPVVSNVFALTAEKAEAKGLELAADIAGLPPLLHGDAVRLGQVLLNLVSNAVKFTEQGSVVLRGQLLRQQDEQLWLRFEVRDTGIGLSAEQQERLFRAFEQADASTTRLYGGTGLGLAISRRLVELMGGQIGVQSQTGQGSCFWFELPLRRGHERPPLPHALPPRSRVLVVDDVDEARLILQDLMERMGARVEVAADGAQALLSLAAADAEGDPFLLLLTDWQMPGMSGSALVARLHQLALRQAPACVLVSGSSGCPREELAAEGFAAFVPKPVLPALLAEAVAAALNAAPAPAPAPTPLPALPSPAPAGRAPHILLVEDNPLNQEVARDLLLSMGYVVDLAADGLEALELAQRQTYDLLLMDIQMPRMDGLEATRRLRQLPAYRERPILAMSANVFAEDRAQALAAGMNDHVPKPVGPERLREALQLWLPAAAPTEPKGSTDASGPLEQAWQERLAMLECLQLGQGLRAVGGQAQRLAALLQRLAQEQGDAAQQALQQLRGVAANLGLAGLAQQARQGELLLAQPTAVPDPAVDALQALDLQIQGLRRSLAAWPPLLQPQIVPVADLQALRERLLAWRALLASDDLDAVDAFEPLQPLLAAHAPELLRPLQQAVAGFALAEALALVDGLLARLPPVPAAG